MNRYKLIRRRVQACFREQNFVKFGKFSSTYGDIRYLKVSAVCRLIFYRPFAIFHVTIVRVWFRKIFVKIGQSAAECRPKYYSSIAPSAILNLK